MECRIVFADLLYCTYSWNLNLDGISHGPITWAAILNGPTQVWVVDFVGVTVSLGSTSHTALLVIPLCPLKLTDIHRLISRVGC